MHAKCRGAPWSCAASFKGAYMSKSISVRLICFVSLLGAALFPLESARGQAVANAGASGQVTDQTGAAVMGATVKMTETEKGVPHTATSDADGRYTLPNLPVGPYRLEATMTGFKTYSQTGIVLQVGDHPTLTSSSTWARCRRVSRSRWAQAWSRWNRPRCRR